METFGGTTVKKPSPRSSDRASGMSCTAALVIRESTSLMNRRSPSVRMRAPNPTTSVRKTVQFSPFSGCARRRECPACSYGQAGRRRSCRRRARPGVPGRRWRPVSGRLLGVPLIELGLHNVQDAGVGADEGREVLGLHHQSPDHVQRDHGGRTTLTFKRPVRRRAGPGRVRPARVRCRFPRRRSWPGRRG